VVLLLREEDNEEAGAQVRVRYGVAVEEEVGEVRVCGRVEE